MRTALLLAVLLALAVPLWAQAPLNFEAEAVCTPTDAWVKDKVVPGKWNLWSTDNDAAKKWSGGVVLQSPPVLKDFDKPEDGCPVLHVVIPELPAGTYEVMVKYGRGLAFSLDQQTWKRCSETGGRIGRFEVKEGKLEFWIDDRFAEAKAWPDHVMQLSAYAAALARDNARKTIRTANCYISTSPEEVGKWRWCEHETDWREVYHDGFVPALRLWQYVNQYKPNE